MKNTKFVNLNENETSQLNENSWVAVIAQSDSEPIVYFYNKNKPATEDIESFTAFTEVVRENLNLRLDSDSVVNIEKDSFSTYYGVKAEVFSDYEEYSGKPTDVISVKAAVVDCFNGGIDPENVIELLKQSDSYVQILESQSKAELKESLKEDKDLYVRYGINRKSFWLILCVAMLWNRLLKIQIEL